MHKFVHVEFEFGIFAESTGHDVFRKYAKTVIDKPVNDFPSVVIDINDDTIIVEFGNNKNCRIPMQKRAVVEVEKANAEEE